MWSPKRDDPSLTGKVMNTDMWLLLFFLLLLFLYEFCLNFAKWLSCIFANWLVCISFRWLSVHLPGEYLKFCQVLNLYFSLLPGTNSSSQLLLPGPWLTAGGQKWEHVIQQNTWLKSRTDLSGIFCGQYGLLAVVERWNEREKQIFSRASHKYRFILYFQNV